MKIKKILIASLLISSQSVWAWGSTGHRVIAEIAEMNLKNSTKKKIKQLLDGYPITYWADWADNIKSDSSNKWKHTFVWHYINFSPNLSRVDFDNELNNPKQDNAYLAIPKLEATLTSKTSTLEDKKEALRFLVHLMGDIHQPMHVSYAEDLGGNKFNVTWFNGKDNLHSVWDSKLIESQKYSYSEYAKILNNSKNKTEKQKLTEGSLENWIFESYQLTNDIYSKTKIGDNLSYDYIYQYKPKMEDQLLKAGLRLAKVLNSL